MTHAHERPSLISRIIDLSGGKWAGDSEEAKKQCLTLMTTIWPKLIEASETAGRAPPQAPQDVEAIHEWGAQQEARQMLNLVAEALLATLNDPSMTPAGSDPTG